MQHAVVIGSTPGALRFAAGLAHEGALVRYLGTERRPAGVNLLDVPWGGVAERVPEDLRPELDALWGSSAPVQDGAMPEEEWRDGQIARAPVRKRDRLARWIGLVDHSALRVPEEGAGPLEARWIDMILDRGGEVLDSVVIEGFERRDGAVFCVEADHGREHVEERLFVDAPIADLLEWSDVPSEPVVVEALTPGHRLQLTQDVERVERLPWRLNTPTGLPFEALTRPGLLPHGQHLWSAVTAHITAADGSLVWMISDEELSERVRMALAEIVAPTDAPARIQRLAWGAPRGGDHSTLALQQDLNALGITPLWRTLGHELTLTQELRWLRGVLGKRR